MKTNQPLILIYGHDENLGAKRQWLLQSRGYRVRIVESAAAIRALPLVPTVRLILFCHTATAGETTDAIALASSRWPEVRTLKLAEESGRAPSGILGQLLHTMDGPDKLITMVHSIVGESKELESKAS
jgi:hypothetical protein